MAKVGNVGVDVFYNLVAQEVKGQSGSPTVARRYVEAMQRVIYKQLALNGSCYLEGFGEFTKTLSPRSGKYGRQRDFVRGEWKIGFNEPKYVLNWSASKNIVEAINNDEMEYPKKKRRKKKTKKEIRDNHNASRRKPKPTIEDAVCDFINMTTPKKKNEDYEDEI